jgi:hypothetical protein
MNVIYKILVTYFFFFTFSFPAYAAIAVDTSASNACDTCSSLTFSLTVGSSGTNGLVVVGVVVAGGNGEQPPPTVTSVTYAGQNLTQIGTYLNADLVNPTDTNAAREDQWYLLNPPTGANNVVITISGSSYSLLGGATSLFNVNQSSPIRGFTGADSESTAASVTISSTTGDLVLDTVCDGTSISSGSQTQEYLLNRNSNNACNNIAGSTSAGAASVNMSWTVGNDIWVDVASSIEPAATTNNPVIFHMSGGKIGKGRFGY